MKLDAPFCTDGYKVGHGPMYRRGTESVNSNNTPRTDRIYRQKCTRFYDGKLVVVGIQGGLQEIHELWEDFFKAPKEDVIDFYATLMTGYFGSRPLAVAAMAELHDVGYLPIEVRSLDEGVKIPFGIPVFTIENTLPAFFWLVNYLETVLSDLTWKPMTNATIAEEYYAIAKFFSDLTGADDFGVSIQNHDFSARGMSGMEDAARSNFGHLLRFIGTDTVATLPYAVRYYDTPVDSLIGISVPATEHAVTSSNILYIEKMLKEGQMPTDPVIADIIGKMRENNEDVRLIAEVVFVYELITQIVPSGIVSNVSDTYDFWGMITRGYKYLKQVILNRPDDALGLSKVVVRPDSGDPVKVVCGLTDAEYRRTRDGVAYPLEAWDGAAFKGGYDPIPEHIIKGAIECLWEIFGGYTTTQGYKLLDRHIGLIYGDSITPARELEILERLARKGFASLNVVFGVGSYTYQCNTRDTFGFAVKATSTVIDGNRIAIFKDPKTDSKKKSARGLLFVGINELGEYYLLNDVPVGVYKVDNQLKLLYKDGKFLRRQTLNEIRERLKKQ